MIKPSKKSIIIGLAIILIVGANLTFFAIYTVSSRSKRAVDHFHRGIALINSRKVREAAVELERAVSLNSDFWEAHFYLGGIYLQQNALSHAKGEFTKVLKLKPDLVEAYNALGIVYFKMGRVDIATAYLEASLRINPLDEHVSALIETINGRGMKYPKR